MTMRRWTSIAVALMVAVLPACRSTDEDCDAEDMAGREAECGYYDGATWVLYPWIVPGVGGHPPPNSHPTRPATAKPPQPPPPKPLATPKPPPQNIKPPAPAPKPPPPRAPAPKR